MDEKGFLAIGAAALLPLLALAGAFFLAGYYLAPQDDLKPSDVIVALSGGDTEARADKAIELYHEGWAPVVIFSGAAKDLTGPSNAEAMARMGRVSGIPNRAIITEERSKTTSENAAFVGEVIQQQEYRRLILVTSPYHQRRAYLTFAKELGDDVEILNRSAVDRDWRRWKWWSTPRSLGLTLSELQKTIFLLMGGRPN